MLLTSGFPGSPAIWHMLDMPDQERWRLHGRGYFEPLQPVVAGEYITLEFHFETGVLEIPVGGRLRLVWLWPFDWADLQAEDPRGDGYMVVSATTVAASEPVEVQAIYVRRGDLIPWNHQIELEITRGCLRQGDRLHLVCGERSGGGRGWRAPTFIAKSAEILMLVNADGSDRWIQLPLAPSFPLVPGPPERLVAIAPSDGVAGEGLEVRVRVEDSWGNPTLADAGAPQLEVVQSGQSRGDESAKVGAVEISDDLAVYRYPVLFEKPGTYRLRAEVPGARLQAESNPVRVHEMLPERRIFWGDLHSGQGEIGCGVGSVAHHFSFARDVAGLQFTTHQGNDHHITLDEWNQVRRESEAFDEPGRFVTFLGCEWSAFTPDGGDRNVVYCQDEPRLRRSGRFFTESEPDPEPDLTTAPAFHEVMKKEKVLINLHAGGRTTNLDFHAPEIEPLAEIHSTHGTSEWFVEDALSRGYKVGITGGTDGVNGRPGADHPGSRLIRNVRSGFTAVYARELSREALWEAFQERRCYATSGERILLWVDVDGHPMGAEYETEGHPLVRITAEGTAPIEQVDLLCGTEALCIWRPSPASFEKGAIRLLWGGTQKRGTAPDQRVVWDGELTVSGGRLRQARPIGFQSPGDEVRLEQESGRVAWQSVTAGNRAGLQLEIEGDGTTLCSFSSEPCAFEFGLDQVRLENMKVDAGGVGRHVLVGPAPADDGPRKVELAYRDSRDVHGMVPYWVRVVQIDQARAWSSPVYAMRRLNQAGGDD